MPLNVISSIVLIIMLCIIPNTNPAENVAYEIPGDVSIGVLLPIHKADGRTCGEIDPQNGILQLIAAEMALERVNRILNASAGFQLGMMVRDTCYRADKALEEALTLALRRSGRGDSRQAGVIGVIGPSSSEESVLVATLLKLFKLPQVYMKKNQTENNKKKNLKDKRNFVQTSSGMYEKKTN